MTDVPQSNVGAPLPLVLAADGVAMVGFLRQVVDPTWDGTSVRMMDLETPEPCALVTFAGTYAVYLGMPNDEAFPGHPLASRGLERYGAFQVERSSWIRRLERMNAIHPYHRPEAYEELVHVVLSFHDSTFECVARSYAVETLEGPLARVLAEMQRRLLAR